MILIYLDQLANPARGIPPVTAQKWDKQFLQDAAGKEKPNRGWCDIPVEFEHLPVETLALMYPGPVT